MARIQGLLKKLEAELYNGGPPMRLERVAATIEDRQRRYDHLAGVPPR